MRNPINVGCDTYHLFTHKKKEMYTDLIPHVTPQHFHRVSSVLRNYFDSKGFLEVHPQNRLSILAACEDPHTIATFNYAGQLWPLPQTNQMWLEHELLKNPDVPGLYCLTTSYRNEPNPIAGRHHLSFPMFEFEGRGNYADLLNTNKEVLEVLGILKHAQTPRYCQYEDVCKEMDCVIISSIHEAILGGKDPVIFLLDFPERSNPFWNMARDAEGLANKCDVLLYGMETIGTAERSCDADAMLAKFITIEGGAYKAKLFNLFGRERVMQELNDFLSLDFVPRFGGGIGVTRLIRAMILAGVVKE